MATTIQVSEKTRHLLELAKVKTGSKSLDETIQKLLKRLPPPKSMFGSQKGIGPFTREDRLDMWGEL